MSQGLLGCCCFWLLLLHRCHGLIHGEMMENFSYRVVDSDSNCTMLQGSEIAVFMAGKWCVAMPLEHNITNDHDHYPLIHKDHRTIRGWQSGLGPYEGVQVTWHCEIDAISSSKGTPKRVSVVTSLKNFESKLAIVFEVEWPEGAWDTNMMSTTDDHDVSLTNFPTFLWDSNTNETADIFSALSWEGSFLQSVRGHSKGPAGGPTVLYNSSSSTLENVMIISPFNSRYWKTFSAGNNFNWRGQAAIAPGTSGRITSLPKGFRQSFLLLQARQGGITAGLAEWGYVMQRKKKIEDVTLQKVGYQTDNGAMYCFCKEKNCSDTLLSKMNELKEEEYSPMGYLSFQGAGASSGRGKGAPWCVATWGVDGGLNRKEYPLDIDAFQRALGIPLQLYAPYFCPENSYFGNNSKWDFVISDESLPGCNRFAFQSVSADQSRDFYGWFLDKGLKVGMASFEPDFMNQNFNCVPNFVQSATNADKWLSGMADAALDRNISVQWCYATPSDLLASLDMPAVTNFRVSFDFCYGASWDIGESSLLVWALGAAPSKDTLWTTDNNRTAIPGCTWTEDHETMAAELHLVLALMSTGPVGISDALGMTNATLLQRATTADGTLLKPKKAITAVDSAFVKPSSGGRFGKEGYIYGTAGIEKSWIFVSFKMKENYGVKLPDFWPPVDTSSSLLAYRTYDDGASCSDGTDALSGGCVKFVSITRDTENREIFVVPKSSDSSPGSIYAPAITCIWQLSCSGWFLLGELKKYVPLSPVRFRELTCLPSGLSIIISGSAGESVNITALKPSNVSNFEVIQQNVIIPDSKEVTVVFGGLSFGSFPNEKKS